jgi:hypothetical protein
MRNHIPVAKAVVAAICTLSIVWLTSGFGVSSTWAASDEPVVSRSNQVSLLVPPGAPVGESVRRQYQNAAACTAPVPPGYYTCACAATGAGTICIPTSVKCCCSKSGVASGVHPAQACPP